MNIKITDFRVGNTVKISTVQQKIKAVGRDSTGDYITTESYWVYINRDVKEVVPIKITEKELSSRGFTEYKNGIYWLNMQTHWLKLTYSGGYWYPAYAQMPEMSGEEFAQVSMDRVGFLHELENLVYAISGKELGVKEDD